VAQHTYYPDPSSNCAESRYRRSRFLYQDTEEDARDEVVDFFRLFVLFHERYLDGESAGRNQSMYVVQGASSQLTTHVTIYKKTETC
jgi:hypothetical protein